MPYLTTSTDPSIRLFYEAGGQGRPVVLVHGWPLSHRMWEKQIDALTDAGYRCIAYDRRGFGDSDRPWHGYDYDTMTADLHDLITTLDLTEAVLAGFSMGGGEVARYFGRYGGDRVSAAMLISAVPPYLLKTEDNPEGVEGRVFDELLTAAKRDRIGFLADFFPKFFNLDRNPDALGDDQLRYFKTIAWFASGRATRQCIPAFGTTDFRQDLEKIDVPTLIVHGDSDQIVPFEASGKRSAELVDDSRLEVIHDAPHGLAATHGDRLSELMIDFLRG